MFMRGNIRVDTRTRRMPPDTLKTERNNMLSWALTFLIIAIIAGVLGFGGIAGTATSIAHVLFVVFLVLFIVSLIFGRRPRA